MKLIFSEAKSDYNHYIFPYAIWAFPEADERPSAIFARGFLPASRNLERFYMCRHIRVRLSDFTPSSENRRIFRKGKGISYKLLPVSAFGYDKKWREFCLHYANIKFGKNVMTKERLDSLFHSKIITHILVYTDTATATDVGIVTLYVEKPTLGYYYYSFYDLDYYERNLGMYMMSTAVDFFAQQGFGYLYLGTCYSRNALYKTQFRGAQFFNGFCWSANLKELKYLIKRDQRVMTEHLAETEEFRRLFYDGDINALKDKSDFRILPNGS